MSISTKLFEPLKPGQRQLSAQNENNIRTALEREIRTQYDPQFFQVTEGGVRHVSMVPPPVMTIWVQIGAHVSAGTYEWDQVRRNAADTAFETISGGFAHDDYGNIRECAGLINVGSGTVVLAHAHHDADGDLQFMFCASAGDWPDDPEGDPAPGGATGETVAGAFWAELTDSSEPYSWKELQWDNATNEFEDRASGRTGTNNAYWQGGDAQTTSLPSTLIVLMRPLINDESTPAREYVFFVPMDMDRSTAIVHRTTLAGSGTYGVREDRTYTEAQLKQASQLDASAQKRIGSQTATKRGWIVTEPVRGFVWDGTNKKFYSTYKDREYDALGRGPITESEEFFVEIIDLTAC